MVNQILKLTIVSVRELNQANVTADVTKKLSAATMIDGVLNSPAQEGKRWLDLEGNHGAKTNRKGNEIERER